ncbi:poly(rC)-binding protein 2-like isoform X2 [Convolutriloba macropyga]|uniref:poly(rC)-binding protein 2-like isoform X2 n=1 Tax=Convolutriloba macropyga TaxID=536237 RepID=UPI003F527991
MLYPAITAQFQNNTPNNTHNFHRLNFLERNNNNSNKIKGFNNYNNNSSSNSSSSVSNYAVSSGNSFSQSNRSNSQDSFSGVENSDYVMTAGGANISVVTANNAATLPYNAGPIDTGSSVAIDELSPTSTGAKVDSTGHQGPFGMNEECSGMEGGGSPTPPQTLTLRLIMQGKEVGSIIGKRGDTIKKFRTESGARINISDGQSIERIVTLTGPNECLNKAFAMISYKFEEDMSEGLTADCPKPPVTLRLIVPASQCGSIIGKGGSKIKEIREHTGCTIQVAGDYLPQSTERAVTISGMPEAITKCIMEICKIMAESPPKGQTLPYKPKPISSVVAGSPIIANTHPAALSAAAAAAHPFAAAAAAAASPNFAAAAHGMPGMAGGNLFTSPYGLHPTTAAGAPGSTQFLPSTTQSELAKLQAAQLSNFYGSFLQPAAMMQLGATAATSPLGAFGTAGTLGGAAGASGAVGTGGAGSPGVSSAAGTHSTQTTQELTIPNDVIGCVIGPHGNRINDIRNSSGASIKISPMTETSGPNRIVTVTGTHQAVHNAWHQIATSLGLDPASLATGVFGSNSGYGNNNATLQAAAAAAAALSSNPSLAGATGLSTNQMLAQLLNPGLPLANLAPVSANPLSMPTNTAGGLYQTANSGGTYAQVQNAAASLNAGASNSSLVNVMRPNFTNLKKARSEAAPY